MDLDQMAYRCPKAEVVETVRLEGYRLTFAAAGSGLATIFPEEGSHVDGVLWSLTGDCQEQRWKRDQSHCLYHDKRLHAEL